MALTYPRAMPTVGVDSQVLEPQRVDYLAPELGGHVGAVAAGFPLWRLELTLGEMDVDEARAWRAFLKSLKGASRLFYGRHLTRDYPRAYPAGFGGLNRAGGGAFPADGAPTSWSVDTAREVLTLNGLPAGFVLSEDDPIGWTWTTSSQPRRTMASAVEAATANGSGVMAVTIDPPLPSFVPGGAAIKLYRPDVIMRIVTDGTQIGPENSVAVAGGRVLAIQDLRP